MKIAIHNRKGSYSDGWIKYCDQNKINYKIVNAYDNDIIKLLDDCSIFLWHFHHANPKDYLIAKPILFSIEQAGKIVYPNCRTGWHFDDKIGQKYLLEAYNLPIIPTFVFYDKDEAIKWVKKSAYPFVFKLRNGASSFNVKLIENPKNALRIIKKAFKKGFRQFDPIVGASEMYRKYITKKARITDIVKQLAHLFIPYSIELTKGRERGYVYFQQFIPNCNYDIRVQFVGNRCYAMKRFVRENDFRASGGGKIDFDGSKISSKAIELSFKIADILNMQTLALDLIPYKDSYLLSEISYAFAIDEGECDYGYWDSDIKWHPGIINPYGWIIEDLIKKHNVK